MVHPITIKHGWEDAFNRYYEKERNGNIIAVTGVKGGSGRSFITICLAIALSEMGIPVLIADCSTHFAAATYAIDKRNSSMKFSSPITTTFTFSISELDKSIKEFSENDGYVIIDLPPLRSPLHLLGLTLADQILFVTRSDNSIRMWKERTRDMIVMAIELETKDVVQNGQNIEKPCWGLMTDCLPRGNHGPLLSELQVDPILNWLGEFNRSARFADWICKGIAPWERSKTELAKSWKQILSPLLKFKKEL